jgi:hypothetical protein
MTDLELDLDLVHALILEEQQERHKSFRWISAELRAAIAHFDFKQQQRQAQRPPVQRPPQPQRQPPVQRQPVRVLPPNVALDFNGKPVQTVWTCDVCRVKEFSDYDRALAHENICQGNSAVGGANGDDGGDAR